ncbi:MAG: galactose oxidase-like domain-containing protein, partial [Anaeromyxobacteraceae bacterium]
MHGAHRLARVAALVLLAATGRTAAQAPDPSRVGRWSPVRSWPSATHVHLLPGGQVMFFGEFESGDNAQLWDPAADALTPLSKAGYNIFCGGHSFLADGTLLVAGGHAAAHVGLAMASLFDPAALRWTRLPDMNDLRWYPTSTTLPGGDALVMSGETMASGVMNELPQVFEAKTRTWRNLSTAVLKLPYYPREFVARNGKVFVAGPLPQSWYLDTQGTGSWSKSARSTHATGRDYGPAVLYRENKIAYFGGDDPPTASVEVIDLDAAAPAWRATAPMSSPRRQHNATLLPDGRVLVTGGSSGPGFDDGTSPVLASEVWDPASESFTPWASLPGYRGYHSAALLLPDGRVLSAGGRGATYYSMEVFSPPYLFAGPRPVITRAPEVLDLAQPFQVETPDAGSVSAVNLVRLGSVTHAFDENQRF